MKKEYGAFKYVDIETECFDLASDEEIGHDAKQRLKKEHSQPSWLERWA